VATEGGTKRIREVLIKWRYKGKRTTYQKWAASKKNSRNGRVLTRKKENQGPLSRQPSFRKMDKDIRRKKKKKKKTSQINWGGKNGTPKEETFQDLQKIHLQKVTLP